MTGRAKALYERGLKELPKGVLIPTGADLLKAIAVMIDQALPEKKTKAPGASQDRVAGIQIHATLKEYAPAAVVWDPASPGDIIVAGKLARGASLTPNDIRSLAGYLERGGLSWMREPPTFRYVARNIVDLVAKAKAPVLRSVPMESELDRLREQGEL